MDAEKQQPESSESGAVRPTQSLEPRLNLANDSGTAPQSTNGSRDLVVRVVEQIVFVSAVIGAVALGLGITSYFGEHRYISAYLLAYIGFRFADLLVGEEHKPLAVAGFTERVMSELPILLVFAGAPFERTYLYGGEAPKWLQALGLLLELIGLWLALGSRIQFHFFSADRSGQEQRVLVKTGFYKFVRHPVLAGILLVLVAWPLEFAAWMTLVFTLVVGSLLARHQIRVDEKVLRDRFGEEYDEYCRTSDALIPSIW